MMSSKNGVLRMRLAFLACLASGVALAAHTAARAQYYAPTPYYYYPTPSERAYPGARGGHDESDSYYQEDAQPRARPRARAQSPNPRDEDYYGPDYGGSAPARRDSSRRNAREAALPSDADAAYSTAIDADAEVDFNESTAATVDDPTREAPGTITIDTGARKLYLSVGGGQAIEYGIGVGREGFAWKGVARVGRKAFWPGWTPPREMLLRRPDLPTHMEGGIENPLGARALYLFKGDKDTLFRIHGTNEPDTIGKAVSSGCIRMLNADVIDLYRRVGKGARVVVL
jgi:lipoprotein-anchoring transpeptidase ErfK/SrfK